MALYLSPTDNFYKPQVLYYDHCW